MIFISTLLIGFIYRLYATVQNAYVLPTHTGICNIVYANIMWYLIWWKQEGEKSLWKIIQLIMNLSVDLNKVQNKGHYLGLDLKNEMVNTGWIL